MEFTYKAYQKLIVKLKEKGYKSCFYDEVDFFEKTVILRHDIDFSPKKALEIAKIEYELGVKSTFFVLLSSEFYNIFSKSVSKALNEIVDMGHQVGLHFDEKRYNKSSIEDITKKIYSELNILKMALNRSSDIISMHRPSKLMLKENITFNGAINSYSKKFFTDMKYVSDSRMSWKEDIFEVIESEKYKKIHILTHPFWYSNEAETTKDKLCSFINQAREYRYNLIDDNFKNLDEYLKLEELI